MSTPNWDLIHLRFASSIRDGVPNASIDGAELSVSDRDSYLNYAYSKYVRLIFLYNQGALDNIVAELFKITNVTSSAGVIDLPSDYGEYVDLINPDSQVTKQDHKEWLRRKSTGNLQSPPALNNLFVTISGLQLLLVPQVSTSFFFSYVILPSSVTEGGSVDIILRANHWDTIIAFAKAAYYRDKQEFDIAASIEADAVKSSPYPIAAQAQ